MEKHPAPPAEVEVNIVDASGHEVASFQESGRRSDNVAVWNPGRAPAGLYMARLRFRAGSREHSEVVLVVFDPLVVCYEELLRLFWESHDPTQGMRQGNDVGTQYRSGIYYYDDAQRLAAELSRDRYQKALAASGGGAITTEILPAKYFYYAEEYHQQYLAKNPGGYCGLGGTGVCYPSGTEQA